jgi:poly-gamma-glutamate synthesis protein (capsule biosynthesis protein)
MVESGADLIVGHHPHVTQDIQFINDVLVFYSLGNFIFDQYFSTDVKEGYILDVTLTNSTSTIKILPHTQIGKSQTEPMQGIQKSDYLESLADRSDPRLSDQIKAGNIAITR